ncbi:hypothetical protein [Chryseobacterium sp. 2987]|uniref:hypothetical protein n=1 Tax=Chryseobacterium sp. 2987 TaxID=2817767 RepID=UPI0028650A9C|nr:hypothetical protein [Chryseobacterium sp. 2987]MDR6919740.1 hypothetical protein [Chryseobacterium sp. 2987]
MTKNKMKPRQFTKYKKLGSPGASPGSPDRMLTSYPAEALVEKDKKYTEQKILIPEFSVPGILAKPELDGLTFHFMAFPTIFEYADFRLIDGNRYELLGFNGKPVSEFTPEFITECLGAMQPHFEQTDAASVYSEEDGTDPFYHKEDTMLLTGKVKWHFSTYLRQTTEEEDEILYDLQDEGELEYEDFDEDFNYTTNYDLPVFKDENGNTLEFICRLHIAHFPGTHYLFYSPETKLVRQFSQFPKRIKREINFSETDELNGQEVFVKILSDPGSVLTDPSHFERRILLPKYSFPGLTIDRKYEGLAFHFVLMPVFNTLIDFRLTADNKYDVLRFDDLEPKDFTDDFAIHCESEMDTYFDEVDEKSRFFIVDRNADSYDDLCLAIGTEPFWDQSDFMREKTDEEIQADFDAFNMDMRDPFDDRDYVTDYDSPELKDENGDTMEFVAKLYHGEVFGSYYLYFSPKTRLVRQFFQCT